MPAIYQPSQDWRRIYDDALSDLAAAEQALDAARPRMNLGTTLERLCAGQEAVGIQAERMRAVERIRTATFHLEGLGERGPDPLGEPHPQAAGSGSRRCSAARCRRLPVPELEFCTDHADLEGGVHGLKG